MSAARQVGMSLPESMRLIQGHVALRGQLLKQPTNKQTNNHVQIVRKITPRERERRTRRKNELKCFGRD